MCERMHEPLLTEWQRKVASKAQLRWCTAASASPARRPFASPRSCPRWDVHFHKLSMFHPSFIFCLVHSLRPCQPRPFAPGTLHVSWLTSSSSCYVRARRLNVIIQPHLRFAYELMKWDERLQARRGESLRRTLDWPSVAREIAAMNKPYTR